MTDKHKRRREIIRSVKDRLLGADDARGVPQVWAEKWLLGIGGMDLIDGPPLDITFEERVIVYKVLEAVLEGRDARKYLAIKRKGGAEKQDDMAEANSFISATHYWALRSLREKDEVARAIVSGAWGETENHVYKNALRRKADAQDFIRANKDKPILEQCELLAGHAVYLKSQRRE